MKKELNIKQKRVMIYFISATKELIEQEGLENLTVRKVASSAGYNSATLYNYFQDMEELVVFASIGYLKDYISKLEQSITPDMNARQRYRTIYEVFSRACFSRPELFYGLFYGKYKKRLKSVISVYYNLFPDELGHHKGEVLQMLTQGEIMERDSSIMPSLVEEGFVLQKNVNQTVTLITRMFQSYLYDAWLSKDERSIEQQIAPVLETFEYIMDKAML